MAEPVCGATRRPPVVRTPTQEYMRKGSRLSRMDPPVLPDRIHSAETNRLREMSMVKEASREDRLANISDTEEAVDEVERVKPYQAYLDAELGIRDHWYPAFFSQELDEGETIAEMRLGERIIFKRAGGRVYGVEDRCAHRGMAFSTKPECYTENTITCWLHGFTYDVRDGKLVQILTEPGSNAIGKINLRSYPVEEHNGVVFVFIGDMDPPPPLKTDVQPKFWNAGLKFHPLMRHRINANWRISAENGFDAGHIYAHRGAEIVSAMKIPLPLGTYSPNKEGVVVYDEEGPEPKGVVKLQGKDVQVWSAEIEGQMVVAANVDPNNPPEGADLDVGLYMPCGLEVDWFPKPGMIHFEWYVPIDEHSHTYMITQSQYCETEEEERAFHEECDNVLGPLVWKIPADQTAFPGDGPTWGFNNLDAVGRAGMEHVYANEDWFNRERLYRPDYIIVRWRMVVAKHMRGIQKRGNFANTNGWSPDGKGYSPGKAPGHW